MIILEKPYVSDFLQKTVVDLQIPVLKTEFARSLTRAREMRLIDPSQFIQLLENQETPLLYSNSENSIDFLNHHCPDNNFTKYVNLFKDKSKQRELFSTLNPDVWYHVYSLDELDRIDLKRLPMPFVIKPVRGHASVGIHAVHSENDWRNALDSIKTEVRLMQDVFPDAVVSLHEYLIERYVDGVELAIDAYFNSEGEPVILDILTHLFASRSDMSDRLYLTSTDIIQEYYDSIMHYLEEISSLIGVKNFPFHMEMRKEANGSYIPIEINPLRFMGFCVADVDYHFYGVNPYQHYFLQQKPMWSKIIEERKGRYFGMFGIDIPKHLDKSKIRFNYDKFIHYFSKVIHHTKMDYTKFPMALYLYAEVPTERFSEFEEILHSDLLEFIDVTE